MHVNRILQVPGRSPAVEITNGPNCLTLLFGAEINMDVPVFGGVGVWVLGVFGCLGEIETAWECETETRRHIFLAS
ncbi:MAG: hypothetical protein MUE48_08390, partial [Desulfobacterales bacterium]|nr:hypothetical protein [Desulfobacterales bacterium]